MTPTTYQTPEIRDSNDNIIKQGSFGKNTALSNSTNDGWIDYVANDLEFLYGLAKDEVVPVSALPASGDMNKTYLLTTNGKTYRWSGTAWVELTNSEAVGRAETAANLAKKWATHTDGTVDGTEYSAKYYAQQASASATTAQDTADSISASLTQIATNTDNIATNTEDIANNTTDIDIAEKRISNIEKLLQGNLYDYQTDTDSKYTKTVPQGAMPYASLDSIGGKTLVMNQYVPAVNADNWAVVNNGKVSLSFADGECTMTATASGSGYFNYASVVKSAWQIHNLIKGHKYYLSFDALSDYGISFLSNTGNPYVSVASATSSSWQTFSTIATASGDKSNLNFIVMLKVGTDATQINVGDVVGKFRKVMFIDLTLLYGAGNEPSTVEEFKAMFPAEYYPYNAGELLSAGVSEVVSHSNNLANPSIFMGAVSGASYTDGYWTCGTGQMKSAFDNNNANKSPVFYGNKVTISFDIKYAPNSSENRLFINIIDPTTNATIEGSSIAFTDTWQHFSHTYTNGANGCKVFFSFGSGRSINIKNFKIEENASETPYSPYGAIATYPIPAEIQALEGYGWSAGTAYNYIDYERKVFVKCVDKIVLNGTQTIKLTNWRPQTNSVGWMYTYSLTNHEPPATQYTIPNIVANKVEVVSYNEIYNNDKNCISAIDGTNYGLCLRVTDTSLTTESAINTYLSANPITVYYELAEPIETDISAYLSDDNLISVESGGTLTFPNSNGDDYRIPVPSEETYMINLQEAVSNG